MQWEPGDRSNIDDARGRSGFGVARLGIGGFILLLLLSWATGKDFFSLLGTQSSAPSQTVGTSGEVRTTPGEERMVDFVDTVTNDAQDAWAELLGGRYQRTRVTVFRDSIDSACGFAQSATGPFYCPSDRKVYLDIGFFDELARRFGAPGEFAQAYVVAHELGHHVQTLLGIKGSSVAMELQADCFAGVWGNHASKNGRLSAGHVTLEPGDMDKALRAAAAIGDDRLQKMATGHVMPDRFTHGTSAQRVEWFKRGMDSGSPQACDTFAHR